MIKLEGLYVTETLDLKSRELLQQWEKKKMKILGPKCVDGQWILRPNKELCKETEEIVEWMSKRQVQFYGHFFRMNQERLTQMILIHFKGKKIVPWWLTETHIGMEKVSIGQEGIKKRNHFRQISNLRVSLK